MSFSILDSPSPSPNTIPSPFPSHSCVTHCPELDLSISLAQAPKPDHMQQKTCQLKQSQHSDQLQQRPHPRRQTERKRNIKVCFEEAEAVRVAPDRRIVPHQHHLRGQRGSSKYRHVGRCSMEPPAAGLVWNPGCLGNAELNSTLPLKVELLSLQEMEFNSKKALQQTLLRSKRTKTLINARAIEVVNVSPSQHLFNSLVSVSVEEDELLSRVLQAKLILAPLPSHHYKSAESPSLNFFITSELFRKKPLQQEEEPPKCKPSPMASPVYSTFDLYRRQRCWEAIP